MKEEKIFLKPHSGDNEDNTLLKSFGVKSFDELIEYVNNNPDEQRVQELNELCMMFGFDLFNLVPKVEIEDCD